MTKTSLFKKFILTIATFSVSLLLAVCFMITPAIARAEIVEQVGGIGSTFDTNINSFTVINDSDADSAIDVAYTVTHRTAYKEAQFGTLPASLDASHDFGYALVKTSTIADNQNIGVSAGIATSSTTFNKDSFYRISVDVNAQSQSNYGGAVIKLNGDEDYYFMNGNNKFITTNGEWSKYTFFLATSQFEDYSASISLTLGDENGTKCIGYAAFDNLEVDRIDFDTFERAKANSYYNTYVEDLRNSLTLIENFDGATYETDGDIYTYTDKVDGPSSNKADGNNSIAISNREEGVSAYGVVSINKNSPITFNKVTSPETGFYLLMIRTKAESDFNGTASVTLNYKSKESLVDVYKTFSIGDITSSPNASHNGWKTNYFIIKGSVISDIVGYISVEYGHEGSTCQGTILVDDIEILNINFADYSKYSSSLTDSSVICDLDSTLVDATGVNGAFYKLRTDTTDVLRPDLWAITTSSNEVEYELVSKESIGYSFTKPSFEIDNNNPVGNVLKIASTTETNFAIDSQVVEIEASEEVAYYKITVLLTAKNIAGAGGATLSLVDTNGTGYGIIKLDGNVEPTLYSFNIKVKDSAAFYVRCALGDNTQGNNLGGKGELYIARINYAKSNAEEYNSKLNSDTCETVNFYYDNYNDYTFYNKYDTADIKDAYSFIATAQNNSTGTAKHGIVELDKVNVAGHSMASTAISYGVSNNPYLDPYLFGTERLARTYGFSADNTNATLTLNSSLTLSLPANDETDEETNASYYYKVVVSARAIVTGEYGLTIGLKNTSGEVIATITDIKDTRVYDDEGRIIRDQFMDFEFYVKLNDESVTAQIFMTFGGDKHTQRTTGFVLFQGYELTPTYETAYENAIANTEEGSLFFDNATETYKFATTSDLSVEKEEGETTAGTTYNPNDTWYYLPSILLAVLILVAVAGYFIKKLVEKAKAKKEKQAVNKETKTPLYATRVDYSAKGKETEETKKEEVIPTSETSMDDFDEDYDMYAVHEVVDPTKLAKEEEIEATQEPVVEQAKEEEKIVEVKAEKIESDEFDD